MSNIEEYTAAVRELVREANASISFDMGSQAYEGMIKRALRRYSMDRPQLKVVDITGTDSKYITINTTNFPDYVDQFSEIRQVEPIAPTLSDNEKPAYIERDEWDVYRDASAIYMYFPNHQPDSSETIRVTYTVPHTINGLDSETVDSVPAPDFSAVVYLGAAEAFLALAGRYAGTSDPTLRSDIVNYRTKSAEFRALAAEMRKLYFEWISKPLTAASQVRDLDFGFGYADGVSWLTHRSASRN